MLVLLPFISMLSTTPAMANSYSGSERRTLQSAISSALHSAELTRYYQQCKEQAVEAELQKPTTDKEQPRMLALLQQKIHSQNIDQLLAIDERITKTVSGAIIKPSNCEDSKGLQTLQDNYEVALFALELAIPLEKPLGKKSTSAKSRSNAEQQDVQQLIARSHAVALVNVVDKQQLSAVQQANYLHPDYQGRYVFKVQHGWRSTVSQYLGMHIFVADSDIAKTAKQWLVFLDKNGHFITAITADKAASHIKALHSADWRYDVHGSLHRN